MKLFSSLLTIHGIGYLFVFILCVSCRKDYNSADPLQLSPESNSQSAPSSILSQTRTANLFNCFGEAVLLLWAQAPGDAQSLSADDGSYTYSNKLSPSRGTLQLQLHDFRFDIPAGATIESITVNARRFKTGKGSIRDYFAYLIRKHPVYPTAAGYGIRWSNPAYYPSAETAISYFQNGSGNTGGLGDQVYKWTPGMINDLNFGVRINTYDPTGSSVVVYYDMVSITVQYSLSAVVAP